ncbi:MAG: hypothetical protein ACKO37_01745 [Vampirovibrionales bacterium]
MAKKPANPCQGLMFVEGSSDIDFLKDLSRGVISSVDSQPSGDVYACSFGARTDISSEHSARLKEVFSPAVTHGSLRLIIWLLDGDGHSVTDDAVQQNIEQRVANLNTVLVDTLNIQLPSDGLSSYQRNSLINATISYNNNESLDIKIGYYILEQNPSINNQIPIVDIESALLNMISDVNRITILENLRNELTQQDTDSVSPYYGGFSSQGHLNKALFRVFAYLTPHENQRCRNEWRPFVSATLSSLIQNDTLGHNPLAQLIRHIHAEIPLGR